MRKIKLLGIFLSGFLFVMPSLARADFFNDGWWYMNSSWWTELGAWTDPGEKISMVDNDDRLNLTTPGYPTGWTDGYKAAGNVYFKNGDAYSASVSAVNYVSQHDGSW